MLSRIHIICALFLFPLSLFSQQTDSPIPVFITAGQSNTDGRVSNDELPQYIKDNGYQHCYWSYGSYGKLLTKGFEPFFPKSSMKGRTASWAYDAVTYYLLDQKLDEDFYVIKWSLGGTAIDTAAVSNSNMYWYADPKWLLNNASTIDGGKSLLLSFLQEIDQCTASLDDDYEIKAFLWHQGESDCQTGANYYDNLRNVVETVRNYLVQTTGNAKYGSLPFVCGTVARSNLQYNAEVEDALWRLKNDMENFYVADMSDGELQADQLHFTAKSAEALGIKMFDILQEILHSDK